MATPKDPPRYEFRWTLRAPVEEVAAVLSEPMDFARWWPSSWLESVEVAPGDADGVGRIASVRTKGRSPLTLEWAARCVTRAENVWSYDLFGDLEGSLHVSVRADGDDAVAAFVWSVALAKPSTRSAPFATSTFASDLTWMMARGDESLRLELARRVTPEAHNAPPGPTTASSLPWTLAGVGVAAALAGIVGLLLRRRP